MNKFNENEVREAAYYIWKNNGCPANTCAQDWNAALNQLNNLMANSKKKAPAKKAMGCATKVATKKSTVAKKTVAKKSTAKKSK